MELGIRGGQRATLSREEQASRIWTMGEKSELFSGLCAPAVASSGPPSTRPFQSS